MIHALRPPFLHRCIASGVLRSRHRNPVPCIIVKEPRDAVADEPAHFFGRFDRRIVTGLAVRIRVEGRLLFHRTLLAASLWAALASPAGADSGSMPDPSLTPGAVRTTDVAAICATDTRSLRHWSRERDDRILVEYGLPPGPHPTYEVDHLVPLCLGGADDDRNLWAQPRRSIEPTWNAERKDELEARMCSLVCSGELDVGEAQRTISEDWTEAFIKFVGEPRQ
jgi:hypothetical protein